MLDRQKQLDKNEEALKIKEWEEKFDREQKAKELKERLRDQKLREKELERLRSFESEQEPVKNNYSSSLEKFDIDDSKKN